MVYESNIQKLSKFESKKPSYMGPIWANVFLYDKLQHWKHISVKIKDKKCTISKYKYNLYT